jgi:CDP-diacylglycerol---serine O-phosphatidyltransferase
MEFKLKDAVTSASLLAGVVAVVLGFEGRIALASFLVLVAWGFDALDGFVARITHSQNAFGGEFDDLVDHVGYTIAPAFIVYAAFRPRAAVLGLAACFATMLLGTVRLALARLVPRSYPGYWIGLPRPATGFLIVFFLNSRLFARDWMPWPSALLFVGLGLLGLTSLPYRNHKVALGGTMGLLLALAIGSSLAAHFVGWMWDVALGWGLLYLLSPWLLMSPRTRTTIAESLVRGKG